MPEVGWLTIFLIFGDLQASKVGKSEKDVFDFVHSKHLGDCLANGITPRFSEKTIFALRKEAEITSKQISDTLTQRHKNTENQKQLQPSL